MRGSDGSGSGSGSGSDDDAPADEQTFDEVVLDESFIRGGAYEPPARTRAAIARYAGEKTSWRHGGGLHQSAPPPVTGPKALQTARKRARRSRPSSWLPAVTALLVLALVIALSTGHVL
jgi:hypothetical protein